MVFQGDASPLVQDQGVYQMLKSNARCVVSSLSISHVIPALERLGLDGVGSIGCGYLYDNVNVGECIVDTGGIRMKRVSDEEAEMKHCHSADHPERFQCHSKLNRHLILYLLLNVSNVIQS